MYLSNLALCFLAGFGSASVAAIKSPSLKNNVIAVSSTTTTTAASSAKSTSISNTQSSPATIPMISALTMILQLEIAHPAYFCNFYLSNGVNQTRSPSRYLSASALTLACQSLVPKVQNLSPLSTGTGVSTCDQTSLSAIAKEFGPMPSTFCQYWDTTSQKYLPLAALNTLAKVSNGCQCLVATTTSTSVASVSSRGTAVLTSTTANSPKSSGTVAQTSSKAVQKSSATTQLSFMATQKASTTTLKTTVTTQSSMTSRLASQTFQQSSRTTQTSTTPQSPSTTNRISSTTVQKSPTTSAPSVTSDLFYLRLTASGSTDPFNGHWVNALQYDMDNGNVGQYLAVTPDMPRDPFALSSTNDLMIDGFHITAVSSGYELPFWLYPSDQAITDNNRVTWTWNKTQNTLTAVAQSWYHELTTCAANENAVDDTYIIWESWIKPAQPLFLGGCDDSSSSWTLEVVPVSSVNTTQATSTSSVSSPTPHATTSVQGMTLSDPFYLKLTGNSSNNMNYSGYYLEFLNFTSGTGVEGMYLGVVKERPSIPFTLNQNNVLIQLNNTVFGTPGFAISRGSFYDSHLVHVMSYIANPTWLLSWNYHFNTNTVTPSCMEDLGVMTCPPSDSAGGWWNSTMMPAPPIITTWSGASGCAWWDMTLERD